MFDRQKDIIAWFYVPAIQPNSQSPVAKTSGDPLRSPPVRRAVADEYVELEGVSHFQDFMRRMNG
jgi:hypothetical protein